MKKSKRIMYCVLVICVILIFTSCKGKEENKFNSEETITKSIITQFGDKMVISTKYGDISYPYAFSDVIKVNELDEGKSFVFIVATNDFSSEIYKICFEADEGTYLGKTLEEKTVSIKVYDVPEEIREDSLTTFYAAQETLNDVIASIYEWEGFVAAE